MQRLLEDGGICELSAKKENNMTNFYAEIVCEPGDLSAARLNRFLDAASAELGCRITSARIDLIGPGSKLQKFRLHAE